MQKCPRGGYKEHYHVEEVVEDFSFKDDYHYNKGSRMQMKPGGHFNHHPNHNMHAYEYDDYSDNFKGGHDGYSIQYTEARYEKEQYSDPWNHRNDYPGHGGRQHDAYKHQGNVPHSIGHMGGGYGGHHGPQHHKPYAEEKPFWNSKAIRD